MSQDSCRIHSTGLIHRVPPDVKHRFSCSNNSTHEGTIGHTYPQLEIVEWMFVDVIQLVVELGSKVYQVTKMVVRVIIELKWDNSKLFVLGKIIKGGERLHESQKSCVASLIQLKVFMSCVCVQRSNAFIMFYCNLMNNPWRKDVVND